MPNCGSQIVLCELPVRFDTYKGCSHMCKYCFVQRKKDIENIEKNENVVALQNFIKGKRNQATNWCDWNIPLHWGGVSDPFQPCEKKYRISLNCLKVFAETKYPFVVSTKGKLIIEKEYLELLSQCNCVVQISMVCSKYDVLEAGAPSFEERLKMVKILSERVPRVIIRIQPYMTQVFQDVKENMRKFAEAGAYGVIVEGMKFAKRKPTLEKNGCDYVYKKEILEQHFKVLKQVAHENGLKFYVGENRLRTMGDNMCCCGIDGLKGFQGNSFNICSMINNKDYTITDKMKEKDTAGCFRAIDQTTIGRKKIEGRTFEEVMKSQYMTNVDLYKKIFGK